MRKRKVFFKKRYLRYWMLFVIGMLLLLCRSLYSLKYPSLYAEDGTWISLLLKDGFLHTALHVRYDYFEFVIVLFQQLALTCAQLFCKGDLRTIPIFITVISCVYYTFVAMLPAMTMGNRLNWLAKTFLFFAILCLPLGQSYTEILGRTLQCHMLVWVIVFCFLVYRYDHKNDPTKKWKIFLIDFLLIFLIPSFPAAIIGYGIYGIIELKDILQAYFIGPQKKLSFSRIKEMLKQEWKKSSIRSLVVSGLIIVVMGCILFFRIKATNQGIPLSQQEPFPYQKLPEILLRVFCYPLVFGIYHSMNHLKALFIVGLTVALFVFFFFQLAKEHRKFYLLTLLSWLLSGFVIIVTRTSIFGFLNHYQVSYPDRYYMISNVCLFFPIAVLLSEKKALFQMVRAIVIFYFCYSIFVYGGRIFTFYKNENDIGGIHDGTWREALQKSYDENKKTKDGKYYLVELEPITWWCEIPVQNVERSVDKKRHTRSLLK